MVNTPSHSHRLPSVAPCRRAPRERSQRRRESQAPVRHQSTAPARLGASLMQPNQPVRHQSAAPAAAHHLQRILDAFLRRVEVVLAKKPTAETLLEVLQIATPELSADACKDEKKMKKALRTLQLHLHPDKYQGVFDEVAEQVKKLFQRLQDFWEKAQEAQPQQQKKSQQEKDQHQKAQGPRRREDEQQKHQKSNVTRRREDGTSSAYPASFNIFEKYPYLTKGITSNMQTKDQSPPLVTQCARLRGHMMLGRRAPDECEKEPNWKTLTEEISDLSAEQVKKMLVEDGPAISTSFILKEGFRRQHPPFSFPGNKNSDVAHQEKCDVLVVGWTASKSGENWLILPHFTHTYLMRSSDSVKLIEVAFCQFDIEGCLKYVPRSALRDVPWFLKWNHCYLPCPDLSPQQEGQKTLKLFHDDLAFVQKLLERVADHNGSAAASSGIAEAMGSNGTVFQLHPPGRRSESVCARFSDLRWDKTAKKWLVIFNSVNNDSCGF
ncbi:unnamed protein product [Amoebophrya sp. A25]|nr:unnamed protein product [Amoebophrya sp. A25]|eukprot:GSA25T00003815001.1